ncbi:hypothetical protein K8R32_04240 [bacterium]|nr:hypothetical protein [bacterium]
MLQLAKFLNYFYLLRQKITGYLTESWNFLYIRFYLIILLLINLLSWALAVYIDWMLDEKQIALHYSVDFGIDYYDNISRIYTIPALGLLLIIFNLFLVLFLFRHKDKRFLSHVLLSGALLANIILLGGIATIYLINFR